MAPEDCPRSLLAYVAAAVVLVFLAIRVFGASGGTDTPAVALDGARPPTATGGGSGSSRASRVRIWVHVAGAVRRPGLYRVASDARAGTAVDAAGGLTHRADLRAINLAATVRDGQQILVPARGERAAAGPVPGGGAAAPGGAAAAPGGAPTGPESPGGAAAPGGAKAKVSLATATVEQLDALDGIGPTLAQRILQWRDAHGGFKSVEQLRGGGGVGGKRFEALRSAGPPRRGAFGGRPTATHHCSRRRL